MSVCEEYSLPGWSSNGSWINNQDPSGGNTQAHMFGREGQVLDTTPAAYSVNPNYNWDPVWGVSPCD